MNSGDFTNSSPRAVHICVALWGDICPGSSLFAVVCFSSSLDVSVPSAPSLSVSATFGFSDELRSDMGLMSPDVRSDH